MENGNINISDVILLISSLVMIVIVIKLISQASQLYRKLKEFDSERQQIVKIMSVARKMNKIYYHVFSESLVVYNGKGTLSERGQVFAVKIDAVKITDQYVDFLKEEFKDESPYLIQEFSFEFAEHNIFADLEKNDKQHAKRIETLAYEQGVPLDVIMRVVVGIVLRDKMLKVLNKESDINKHPETFIADGKTHRDAFLVNDDTKNYH